jgi:SEC-C motif
MSELANTTSRNEPCPCGSGKKYKRCCGISAAPKLNPPKSPSGNGGGFDPSIFNQMDPQVMGQFTQAMRRLPRGQLQRLQALMQKAMNGRDIRTEAAEFEKTLPLEFQNLIHSMSLSTNSMASSEASPASQETPAMTEEQARALVTEAAASGKISQEQAETLLQESQSSSSESSSKLGRFWKNITGKKNS